MWPFRKRHPINVAEGLSPANVNNAIRLLMAEMRPKYYFWLGAEADNG
jgi:hypothetical protein